MKISLLNRKPLLPVVYIVLTILICASPQGYAQDVCENNAVVCFDEVTNQSESAAPPLPMAETRPVEGASAKTGLSSNQISPESLVEVQEKLANGITADLKARRLMRPKGNNALQKVRELRVLLPTHDYAVNGERYIARVYMVLGRAAVKNGQVDLAKQRLSSAVKMDASVAGQAQLQDAIRNAMAGNQKEVKKPLIKNYVGSPAKVMPKQTKQTNGKKTALLAPVMVAIPAGKFVMGSEAGAEDEKPMREVSIEAFSMSKYEITMEQYRAYSLDNGMPAPQYYTQDRNLPVTNVSRQDAQNYADWLAQRTQKAYRLPSEAEWEYAARAGTVTPFHTGDDLQGANCVGCGGDAVGGHVAPVGSFPPNQFGLYDMHGNVWEWVQDCWTDNYFGRGDNSAAISKKGCERFVMRGGSWYNPADYARSSYRANEVAAFRDKGVGFRVVHDGL